MAEAATIERHSIGANMPPADLLLGEPLRERLSEENAALLRRRDELLAAAERVPPITDEDISRKVTDFIVQLNACSKASEAAREGAKGPYLQGGREVDGFFKHIAEPLQNVKRRIEASLTVYLRQKEATERREREERERQAREEAARKQREADEAAAAMRKDSDLVEAVERQRLAEQAEADRIKAEAAANAKAAELSRTRGEYGGVSSLRTFWTFADLDRAQLDLEALREHLPMDGLERAVRSFVKAGGRSLRGVHIYETTQATVR
jgi:hypothetical protein